MKKIVLAILILLLFSSSVFAKEEASPSATASVSPTPISYTLPYPGILPGHPLYPIKAARDRLVEFLIRDNKKKAEFYLLQADKRLYAGELLFKQGSGKHALAEETISKGENYLDKAFGKAVQAKTQNEATEEILGKIHLSSVKHQQVIIELLKNTSGDLKVRLENDLKKAESIQKKVEEIKPDK